MRLTETAITATQVGENLEGVRERIASAGRDPDEVTIVAMTKQFGHDAVRAAIDVGLVDVGENYAANLREKALVAPDARWHFLGRVQRNKVKSIAALVSLWQGVDRLAAGVEIARRAPGASVLVQVNLVGDPNRPGCTEAEAGPLVDGLSDLGLLVQGLMGVAGISDPRSDFRRLATLASRLGLDRLSMGMSGDLEIAVQEGSTMVRVGTALFGNR